MEREHAHSDDALLPPPFQPIELKECVSPQHLSKKQLRYLWQVSGRHPSTFNKDTVMADIQDPYFVQSIMGGKVPNMDYELFGVGEKIITTVVGWMRARIGNALPKKRPYAVIENPVRIDRSIQCAAVEDVLLACLQKKVSEQAHCIAGLKVCIEPHERQRAVRYFEHGFHERSEPNVFVWKPKP